MLRGLALCAFVAFAPSAGAQALAPASFEAVAQEARYEAHLEGPLPGTTRGVAVWRPADAPPGPLPTIYVADGARGLYTIVAWLKPLIEAGRAPPILVVGFDADPAHRSEEYIPGWRGGARLFQAHARWVIERVIPWAEQAAGADPARRVIAGNSNGADFALALARERPDLFVGVLAHSPVATHGYEPPAGAAALRWALSGGAHERDGETARQGLDMARRLADQGASVRRCTGRWGHEISAWIDLSPGAAVWTLGLTGAEGAETPLERENCSFLGPVAAAQPLEPSPTQIIKQP